MAKQNLNIGSAANDGTGDSLRDGAIKLNSVINEIYTALGNDTNLQINVDSPSTGDFLKWNGSLFTEGSFDALTSDLDVGGNNITSATNGDVTLKPHGTGDIKLWAGSTGSALTYIDGADGKLKYSNHFDDVASLPDATNHHGMFAHAHDEGHGYFAHAGSWTQLLDTGSSIGELSDVDMTVGGGPSAGQVLKWNGTENRWEPANDATGDGGGTGTTQNLFETIAGDTGSTTASAATDTLTVAGGTNISTSITGDTLTINMTGALGEPDQNLFSVIGSDSGSKTANSTTTTVNFVGGTGISTAISGDNLTITNTSPNADQNIFATITGDTGTLTADSTSTSVQFQGGIGVSTTAQSGQVVIDAEVAFASPGTAPANSTLIADEDGMYYKAPSPTVGFTVSAFGSSAYTFEGGGVNSSTNNPTIYVYRGFTYRFNNTSTSAHPFALRTSNGGAAVTDGVTGSQSGVQYWTVPMALSAGTTYVYQCTIHSGMVGNIVVV